MGSTWSNCAKKAKAAAGFDRFHRYGQPMVRNPDMPYQTLIPGFQHDFIQAGSVTRFRTETRIVELIDIQIIGLQLRKGCMQLIPELINLRCHGLGCDKYLVTHIVYKLPCKYVVFRTVRTFVIKYITRKLPIVHGMFRK